MVNKAQTAQEIQKTTSYILNATPEEIWFWTSKLLDDEINTRALESLAVLSGATKTSQTRPSTKQTPLEPIAPQKGTFWPIVRQRMEEKAMQLYKEDHLQTETAPSLRELRKSGYLEIAKTITLREVNHEKKNRKITTNQS